MIVFIDDSGDPGFKFDKGSSPFFVIALIIFSDELEAEKTAVAIKELKRELKIPETTEFKFSHTQDNYKKAFFEKINSFDFVVRTAEINKTYIMQDGQLEKDKESFYSYAIKQVLRVSEGAIVNAKLRMDGSGDKVFRREFLSYLRTQLNSAQMKIIQDCKFVDSKTSVLVQMADMIAGAVRRAREDKKQNKEVYLDIIRNHIKSQWDYPIKKSSQ